MAAAHCGQRPRGTNPTVAVPLVARRCLRDRCSLAGPRTPIERARAGPHGIAPTRVFLRGPTTTRDLWRTECRAERSPAIIRSANRDPLHQWQQWFRDVPEGPRPHLSPGCGQTPACRDNAPPEDTARVRVAPPRLQPPPRTEGARRRGVYCDG